MTLEDIRAAHLARAAYIRENLKPSARKSFGSYKPLVVRPNGSTEVVGTRAETRYRTWIDGKPDPRTAYTHYERGKTFSTRPEAIAFAVTVIERRALHAEKQAAGSEAAMGSTETKRSDIL